MLCFEFLTRLTVLLSSNDKFFCYTAQHQNLEVNFLRFSRIWPIINSMLHRSPIKLVQCQRDSTVLVNTFLLVLTIFFFSRIMYAIKVLLPRAKTKMFNAEFAFVLSSDSGKMSVHACKFLQAQRNGIDTIFFFCNTIAGKWRLF